MSLQLMGESQADHTLICGRELCWFNKYNARMWRSRKLAPTFQKAAEVRRCGEGSDSLQDGPDRSTLGTVMVKSKPFQYVGEMGLWYVH